ncbi:nuclear transport factor 2 family protein [Novosphingobium mangrovi (ex Hu et al. 2023)]|uniref:Nuclear transport factor 2 family protein n=1 Tax=Novosphingobium mangrovi (ex Hu et al. 2023) TaxID=2930094 RepID=A0ABT0ACV5_9SPHN|nr:nuclear transport factor 2 family protein [Novosphingobium mangrovi (ex Hu et al. 2023)]MCJ1961038.1 nuclear transport factor 2 family protein [Novosphingobium mangrovi (ex Hu et al. 2023)]
MTREDYDRYAAAFNARDYDAVYDFYAPGAHLTFFGVDLATREAFRDFYGFLHDHVEETLTIERFAASDELVALEGVIRIEARKDLTAEALAAQGLDQFFPIRKGEVQELRQYIHYHVTDGQFTGVSCALMD